LPKTSGAFTRRQVLKRITPIACDRYAGGKSVHQDSTDASTTGDLIETYNPNKWAVNRIDVMCLNAEY
jgi:hypothetical protein